MTDRKPEVTAKETWALVCESGWVHAVHNARHNADRAVVSRSVPLDQVDPEKGLHNYTVVRYVPADSLDLGRADADQWRAKFARVVYLGNAARPLDMAERDELTRLLNEGYEVLRAAK